MNIYQIFHVLFYIKSKGIGKSRRRNLVILLPPQFTLAFKILGECFPLHGVLLNVGLCAHIVDELRRIAVIQVVAGIVLVFANRGIVQHKVGEYAAVEIGHERVSMAAVL